MNEFNREEHWQKIYSTKHLNEVSWYQPIPETSIKLIRQCNLDFTSRIIDIGGGDSFLVDHLLELGFQNITVLDISAEAINRAKKRLGEKANQVNWIVSDILHFNSSIKYDCWHDRAAYHFLTDENDINNYINLASDSINNNGHLIVGTFSEQGPKKCSGIDIKQYSIENLITKFSDKFSNISCENINHNTPFNTTQNFTFCSFSKK